MATIVDRLENAYAGRGIDPAQESIDRVRKNYALKKRSAVQHIRHLYRRLIPEAFRSYLKLGRPALPAADAAETDNGARPKLSTRKFFRVLHNQNAGAVRFNLIGRDRYGIVAPGKEFDELRQRVIRDLLDLVNVESGDRAITQIVDIAEHYHGERLADLPDLLLVWSRSAPIRGVRSPLIGTVKGIDASSRTGDHNPHTLLIMAGPEIAPGEFRSDARVEDFAPTITNLLGVELSDIDGSSLMTKARAAQRANR